MEVNITINKSRVKCHKSLKDDITETSMPDKQEFEIELYNDTPDVVLAKIDINNKPISYSGLILNPGQRIFLDRYLDTPNKFIFNAYIAEEGSNLDNNGIIKIYFYKELEYYITPYTTIPYNTIPLTNIIYSTTTTGRIEKGNESSQKLDIDNTINFNMIPFYTKTIKIIPVCANYTLSKNYCSECGAKLKTTYKYCPMCGYKI